VKNGTPYSHRAREEVGAKVAEGQLYEKALKLDAWDCRACILRIGGGTGIEILVHFTMERESGLQAIP
jgi:hypothetical protein